MKYPIKPMLLTLAEETFNDNDYLFEIKYDGVRMLAYKHNGKVFLFNRNLVNKTNNYPEIVQSLGKMQKNTIIDGEIIAPENNKHSFKRILERDLVKNYRENNIDVIYYIFDCLVYEGKELYNLPLLERKKILEKIKIGEKAKITDYVLKNGNNLFNYAKKAGLEGIIAKKIDSKYYPNFRTKEWLKIKISQSKIVLIGGVKFNKKPSFAIGENLNGKFVFLGFVGNGLALNQGRDIYRALELIKQKENPFFSKISEREVDFFCKPLIKLEVKYLERTNNGNLRHPVIKRVL